MSSSFFNNHDELENKEPISSSFKNKTSRSAMGKNPTSGQKAAFGAALDSQNKVRKIRARYANSPSGILMQTVEGIPAAEKKIERAVRKVGGNVARSAKKVIGKNYFLRKEQSK